MTLNEWRVFERMPIFKVLLAGVDFVSVCRSWTVFAIVSFSLLYTVLVKHIGEVWGNEFSSFWAVFICVPEHYFQVVSCGQTLLLSTSY
jgi:hypothetical protein